MNKDRENLIKKLKQFTKEKNDDQQHKEDNSFKAASFQIVIDVFSGILTGYLLYKFIIFFEIFQPYKNPIQAICLLIGSCSGLYLYLKKFLWK